MREDEILWLIALSRPVLHVLPEQPTCVALRPAYNWERGGAKPMCIFGRPESSFAKHTQVHDSYRGTMIRVGWGTGIPPTILRITVCNKRYSLWQGGVRTKAVKTRGDGWELSSRQRPPLTHWQVRNQAHRYYRIGFPYHTRHLSRPHNPKTSTLQCAVWHIRSPPLFF